MLFLCGLYLFQPVFKRLHLRKPVGRKSFFNLRFQLLDSVLMASLFFLAIHHNGGGAVADHHPIKAGVVLLTDRVKFMIVATGA